jgi:type II secretory pathway pseudopilin PulG
MLLALLLTLAVGAVAVLATTDVWSVVRQRQDEQELLFVGDQFRLAIERYYNALPGARALPPSFEDLLEDPRFPKPVSHLRRVYLDPITGTADWGVVKLGTRIAGVFSRSERAPLKKANFDTPYQDFEGRETYSQWRFVFTPPGTAAARPTQPGAPTPPNTTGPK